MLNGITKERYEQLINDGYEKADIEGLIAEWGVQQVNDGYGIFNYNETGLLCIQRLDEVGAFEGDIQAAQKAIEDGVKIIPVEELPKNFNERYLIWIDTPENRKNIEEYCNPPKLNEGRKMIMAAKVQNPDNEKNFIIQTLENGFVVRSDSDRFGMNEIVFQGINYKECLNYISKRIENRKPTYYVIKDLSSWRSDIRELYKLENSDIERFDMLDEAIHKFNEYKRQDYLKQEIVDPETGKPMRRLALGVSCIGEMDLLHTEGEKTLLISDIVAERKNGYETFMTNEKFIRDLNRIVKEISIDEYSYYRDLTIEELAEQRLHQMQTDSPELEYTMEEAMRFAHYHVSKHPYYLSNHKVNERIPFADFSAPYLYEEPKKITLHIRYKEPKNINGFKVEEDTIEFGSICELKQYLRGEATYDVMDNTVRKRKDEVPVSANDEAGKIVWQAGNARVAAHNKH